MAKVAKRGLTYKEKQQWERFCRTLFKSIIATRKRGGHVNLQFQHYVVDNVTPFGIPGKQGTGTGDIVFKLTNVEFNTFKCSIPTQA
jgi:hypothetical protein